MAKITYRPKMKNKKYDTVGTVPKSNRKIVKRGKIDLPNTQIHDCSVSLLGTYVLIKVAGLNKFNGPKPPLGAIMQVFHTSE